MFTIGKYMQFGSTTLLRTEPLSAAPPPSPPAPAAAGYAYRGVAASALEAARLREASRPEPRACVCVCVSEWRHASYTVDSLRSGRRCLTYGL